MLKGEKVKLQKQIKKIRNKLGLNQIDMAREVGISYQTYRRIETGVGTPSPLVFEKVYGYIIKKV